MDFQKIISNMDFSKGVWFPITIGTILLLFALLMPKRRINWNVVYITLLCVAGLAWMIDTIMGSIIDIYDMGAPEKTGIGDFVTLSFIPSALSIIFLNFYKQDKKWFYIILFTLLSSAFEYGLVKVGYMKLKMWHTWWSIPFYIFMYWLYLPWQLKILRGVNQIRDNRVLHKGLTITFLRKQKAK